MIFGAIGNLIGGVLEGQGERKALNAQIDAINSLEPIDVEKSGRETSERDVEFYNRSLEEFRKLEPELAQARDIAQKELVTAVEGAGAEFDRTERLLESRIAEANVQDPLVESIRNSLLEQTRDNLARGATLPPEFQAELVRTGLEAAGTTGVKGSRQGPVAARLGQLIGSAGLQLEQQRRAEAGQMLQLDDALTQSRQAILGDLVRQSSTLPGARAGFFGTTQQALSGQIKPVGLTGRDLLGLDLNNVQFERDKIMQIGQLTGQKALSEGKMQAGLARNSGALVDSVAGAAFGGGIGGMLGGLGGGGGGGFGSLFGGGTSAPAQQTVSSPLFGSVSAPIGGGRAVFNRTPTQQAQFNYYQGLYE